MRQNLLLIDASPAVDNYSKVSEIFKSYLQIKNINTISLPKIIFVLGLENVQ